MPTDMEERRKKVTLKKIERKHAGKIVQPYKILEELIEAHHTQLRDARFCLLWKSGWKPSKDRILKRAQVRKTSEAAREVYGDYDYLIMLHRELWASERFKEAEQRHDIDHELCHCEPEIDDATGEQKVDERDRLCWRVRSHPIQEFPEIIERYGLEQCLGIDAAGLAAIDDAAAQRDIEAEENDAQRPLLAAAEGDGQAEVSARSGVTSVGAAWREWTIGVLGQYGLPPGKVKLLEAAFDDRLGKLVDRMNRQGAEDHWWKDIKGFGESGYNALVDAIMALRKARPEFQAD